MTRRSALTLIAVFLAVLFVPGVLTVVERPHALVDNRAPAPAPHPHLRTLADGSYFGALGQHLQDRLAVRNQAIALDATLDESLFGVRSPEVTRGRAGWLFLARRSVECDLPSLRRAAVRLLHDAPRGTTFRLVIGPEKQTVYPERLRARDAGWGTCSRDTMAALVHGLSHRRDVVDVWSPLRAAATAHPAIPVYYRLDTHWNDLGGSIAARAVLDSLAPGRWDPSALVSSTRPPNTGDLTLLLGRPAAEATRASFVRRPEVTVDGQGDRSTAGSSGPWLLAGRTVVVHDSFADAMRASLDPYLGDVTYVAWEDLASPAAQATLRSADTVIVEVVERTLTTEAAVGLHR